MPHSQSKLRCCTAVSSLQMRIQAADILARRKRAITWHSHRLLNMSISHPFTMLPEATINALWSTMLRHAIPWHGILTKDQNHNFKNSVFLNWPDLKYFNRSKVKSINKNAHWFLGISKWMLVYVQQGS